MQHVANDEARQDLLKQLHERLGTRLDAAKAEAVGTFADYFYAAVPLDDLENRRLDDVYGATLSVWHFLQQFDPAEPKVRVFNPDFEEHGWQSPHTFVAVLHEDMPFLVDSVRIELNRRGLTVHAIHNAVLATERGRDHRLARVASPKAADAPAQRESLIVIEIDRHSDAEVLQDMQQSLEEVLVDVRTAVADFDPMRAKVEEALAELRAGCPPQSDPDDHAEAITFLEWMLHDNFTFLGYDAYAVTTHKDGKESLDKVKDSELGVFRLDQPRYRERIRTEQGLEDGHYVLVPELLTFSKSAHHARVHRPTYPDYISIDRYDAKGNLIGVHRFLGLFTATVYNESPRNVPILRRKLKTVMDIAGFNPKGYNGKHLLHILEVYPRDDLFQIDTHELAETALGILSIRERRRVRLFVREDRPGRFYSCLAFVPRDVFSTELRLRIQDMLCEELDATFGDFNTYLSESVLARIQFILRFKGEQPAEYDLRRLEAKLAKLARNWRDDLHSACIDGFGEEQANHLMARFRDAFPASYRDDFSARTAVYDLHHIGELDDGAPLSLSLYRLVEEEGSGVNLKLFHRDAPIPLSDVLPMMENLGLRVIGERPYEIEASDAVYWIHDFDLEHHTSVEVNLQEMREPFIEAFQRIWAGEADNDAFNRLIIGANLDWREVAMLRAYARYLKQIRLGFDLGYIASTLNNHTDIARELTRLFKTRFYLARKLTQEDLDDKQLRLEQAILTALDDVQVLNEDRILRRYLDLIKATLRTNFYQPDANGQNKSYFSFKFNPTLIPELPKRVRDWQRLRTSAFRQKYLSSLEG